MQSEEQFLRALAERPDDRALRLVFCDWLLDRNNPRGEAMSLFDKGKLNAPEKRRLNRLQAVHAGQWLGPLAEAVVLERCRFDGGLLRTVRFRADLPLEVYQQLTGEPRLGTVRSLALSAGRQAARSGDFLAHSVLARVEHLETDVASMLQAQRLAFVPRTLLANLWHPREELAALAVFAPLRPVAELAVSGLELFNPRFADELATAVMESGVLVGRTSFEAVAPRAVIEGVAHWLRLASALVRGPGRDKLNRWSVTHHGSRLSLEGEHFETFRVELSDFDEVSSDTWLAAAASVLSTLGGIGIRKVLISRIPARQFRQGGLDALRAAVRRLRTVEEFTVGGVPKSP